MEFRRRSDLGLDLRVDGCEAMRDLMEAKRNGVEYDIALKIESSYALCAYVEANNVGHNIDELQDTGFLLNMETDPGSEHSLVDGGGPNRWRSRSILSSRLRPLRYSASLPPGTVSPILEDLPLFLPRYELAENTLIPEVE